MSGINTPPLDDLKRRIEAQGVPVEIRPAAEIPAQPLHTPEAVAASEARLDNVTSTPEGVPVKHTQLDVEKRFEEVAPATSLDRDFTWFFLGFPYVLIPGLDRSLIEVYQAAGGKTIPVKTHRTTGPVAVFNKLLPGSSLGQPKYQDVFSGNPWNHIVQGLPTHHADGFRAFVASYRFKAVPGGTASAEVTRADEQLWRVEWMTFRISDPVVPAGIQRPGVEVSFALPINETTGRAVALQSAPGLFLAKPAFMMQTLVPRG